MSRIAILGAGAWGTALALSLARRGGHELCLWAHSIPLAEQLSEAGENLPYLPGFTLPADIHVTSDLTGAIFEADILLCVTPSQHLRGIITHLTPMLTRNQIIVSASKGLEETTYLRMSQVIASLTGNPCAVLSGPSFAQEVPAGIPTALVGAADRINVWPRPSSANSPTPTLRLYTNDDVTGVELGGSLKNVIALASGVVNGLNLGHNSAAALITRGIAKITPSRCCLRWPPPDACRSLRHRRSRPHLHRLALAQPVRRDRTRQRPPSSMTSSPVSTAR